MRRILLTSIALLFSTLALALPPHPDPFRVTIGNHDSIWVMEVNAREVPGYQGIIPDWVGATVTVAEANNINALISGVTDYYSLDQGNRGLNPLYPVLPDNKGEWRWATLTTCSTCIGRLVPSNDRPLDYLPPIEMAYQLLPIGATLASLINELVNGNNDNPLDLVGSVSIDYWPVRCLEQDTTLLIGGRTIPIRTMDSLTFADEFVGATPGGHIPIQTHKAWIDTATNNHVWITPGTDRWNAYQLPGFLCQTRIVGLDTLLVPWELGITEDQYDSLYSCGQLWPQVLQPLANAHGLDVSIYNRSRVLVLTHMRTWTGTYGTPFWPRAWPGYFILGIYQGDSLTRDLSATGVFVHEWGHAAAGFGDDYSSQSGPHNNRNNVR
jgi:hypothetical protein